MKIKNSKNEYNHRNWVLDANNNWLNTEFWLIKHTWSSVGASGTPTDIEPPRPAELAEFIGMPLAPAPTPPPPLVLAPAFFPSTLAVILELELLSSYAA